jgi:UDP-N-acetylglucosamine 2-epimerase (non-hydrolysing)
MLYLVAGARPNFIKLAPLVWALRQRADLPYRIIHTGQHYDDAMSHSFFRALDLPDPDVNLEAGSGTQGVQTGRVLERFERLLLEARPQAVVVFGDVNSTLACTLASAKLGVPVAHVEAGLRSFDRSMPEEINRLVTDTLAELLFASEPAGVENLAREGIDGGKVHLVGNIMIDSLERMLPAARGQHTCEKFGLQPGGYGLLTLHRPSNVDDETVLRRLISVFVEISERLPLVFAAHPRTRQRMEQLGLALPEGGRLHLSGPLNYLDAISLQADARLVFTDSGGMQEETTHLGVPCITLRENTERPVTVSLGTSTLVGSEPQCIRVVFDQVIAGTYKTGAKVPGWDGHTAGRVAACLAEWLPVHSVERQPM